MSIAYLSLGSNIESRRMNLLKALRLLKAEAGMLVSESSLYETEAWQMEEGTNAFLNQVIAMDTFLSPHELMDLCLRIEEENGRVRDGKVSSRTIDIDILLYDDLIVHENNLTLPHPRMQLRRFVLMPLNEIAAELIHPTLKKNINELLQNCNDTCEVKMYEATV